MYKNLKLLLSLKSWIIALGGHPFPGHMPPNGQMPHPMHPHPNGLHPGMNGAGPRPPPPGVMPPGPPGPSFKWRWFQIKVIFSGWTKMQEIVLSCLTRSS